MKIFLSHLIGIDCRKSETLSVKSTPGIGSLAESCYHRQGHHTCCMVVGGSFTALSIKSFVVLAVLHRACNEFVAPISASLASHWQYCVQFDRYENRTSDLPLQRQRCYCSTNWPVTAQSFSVLFTLNVRHRSHEWFGLALNQIKPLTAVPSLIIILQQHSLTV